MVGFKRKRLKCDRLHLIVGFKNLEDQSVRLCTVPVAELQERKDKNVPAQHSTLTLGFKKVQQYQGVPDYVQYIDTGLQESTTRPM